MNRAASHLCFGWLRLPGKGSAAVLDMILLAQGLPSTTDQPFAGSVFSSGIVWAQGGGKPGGRAG